MDSAERQPVILNFLPITAGGGLQNALSLLNALSLDESRRSGCVPVVRAGTELYKLCLNLGMTPITVADSRRGRLAFECRCRSIFARGQTCFTLFGPVMLRSSGHLLNVTGNAYSNLFHPEVPFWSNYSGLSRIKRELIDHYRRRQTALSDYWIFETEALRERAIRLCGFPEQRVAVVKMAPSRLVAPEHVDDDTANRLDNELPEGFRLLFLNGAHHNKQMHRLPAIAEHLKASTTKPFSFVTTMPQEHPYTADVCKGFATRGLTRHHCNIGPVAPSQVSSLISTVNAMCTFSRLESFSNNFIEAWKMDRPLIVTDADWSRRCCGEGAHYLDPSNSATAAMRLKELMESESLRSNLLAEGRKQLASYPDAKTKLGLYFEHIERARQMGPCATSERRKIHWPRVAKS